MTLFTGLLFTILSENKSGLLRYYVARNDDNIKLTLIYFIKFQKNENKQFT